MKKIVLFALALTSSIFLYAQDDDKIALSGSRSYTHKITNSNGFSSQEIEYDGKIVFNSTDTDVESISRGGFLKITKKTFGTKRTVLLEGKADGRIERTFYIGGREEPWEPEGREWLADNLIDLIRSTGIGAETRVNRFYKQGGLNAVFDEIDEINSDFIKGKYFSATVEIDGLNENELSRVIEEASKEIGSDFETSRFLIGNSKLFVKSDKTLAAVLEFNSEISSDFEQSRVLQHYLKNGDLNGDQKMKLIKATKSISSDFEQSRVITTFVKSNQLSDDELEELMSVIPNISSDFEASRVLQAIITSQDLNNVTIGLIIDASNEIGSDFEQSRVLQKLGDQSLSKENLRLIALAVENISSDFEKSRMLKEIISKFDGSDDLGFIIKATEEISSDFEQSRILTIVGSKDDLSNSNFILIVEATENISSSFEKRRVLGSLISNNDLDKQKSLAILDAIEDISSSFEKSNLLVAVGPKIPNDQEVINRFRTVAKTITSDHEYGKVMRSVDF